MFDRYSILSRQAVFVARKEAGDSGVPAICSEHLLLGIVGVHPELINQLGIAIEPAQIRTDSEQWHARSEPIPDSQDLRVADELVAVLERAVSDAGRYQCGEIRTEHLLLSLMEEPCHAAQLLAARGLSKERIAAQVASVDCHFPQLGATGLGRRFMTGG